MQKNKLKMAERVKYNTWHHKTCRREHRQNILCHKLCQCFCRSFSQGNGNKRKINRWDLYKLKSFRTTKETIKKTKRGTRRRPLSRPYFAGSQLAPLPLQPCLTNPIWLRLRNLISRNWRKQKRERKIHCLHKKVAAIEQEKQAGES